MTNYDLEELKAGVDDLVSAIELAKATIEQQQLTIFSLEEKNSHLALNALGTIVDDYEQRKELAAQRRTIATLRARLANRNTTPRSIWESYFEWPLCLWPKIHEARIAAIRNFGALP